jgi:hypothetical protein
VYYTTPSGDFRMNRRERNPRQSVSWPKLWGCRIDRLSDRLTGVTDYPHLPESPVAQGIGTPICGCVGFRGRVSQVRILPGPLFVSTDERDHARLVGALSWQVWLIGSLLRSHVGILKANLAIFSANGFVLGLAVLMRAIQRFRRGLTRPTTANATDGVRQLRQGEWPIPP